MADTHHENLGKHSTGSDLDGRTEIENASYRGNSKDAGHENMNSDQLRVNINAKIANPLAGYSHSELALKGEEYVRKHQIGDDGDIRAFRIGAILAQDPNRHAEVDGILAEESEVLKQEISNKWSQPKLLYLVIVLCSTCAAVQGMGEFPQPSPY
jgi:hypothetical protein